MRTWAMSRCRSEMAFAFLPYVALFEYVHDLAYMMLLSPCLQSLLVVLVAHHLSFGKEESIFLFPGPTSPKKAFVSLQIEKEGMHLD
jgi:hypothetical protein